jgi:2'-5' RNA ligase
MTRDATARLFVAVDPPPDVRAQLAAWARGATGQRRERGVKAPLRLLDPELLHVTLCFLGARPVAEIAALGQALAQCAEPVGEVSIGAPLWLPPRRPRALAVELHDSSGGLARLHAALALAFETDGAGATHAKRFRPHVTLARMREGAVGRAGSDSRQLAPTPPLAFTPTELVLYRSWLAPEGASYEPLARATLIPA